MEKRTCNRCGKEMEELEQMWYNSFCVGKEYLIIKDKVICYDCLNNTLNPQ